MGNPMSEFIEKRPTVVSVIGWFWIIVGGLMALSGSLVSLGYVISGASAHAPDSQHMPALFIFIFRHFVFVAVIQVCFGALAALAGWQLLRLRAWARSALEGLSWIGLVCIVSWAVAFNMALGTMHRGEGFDSFSLFRILVGAFSVVFYGVPLGLIVYFLRSPKVRDAVRLVHEEAQPSGAGNAR
jgi:hypothetical protein